MALDFQTVANIPDDVAAARATLEKTAKILIAFDIAMLALLTYLIFKK